MVFYLKVMMRRFGKLATLSCLGMTLSSVASATLAVSPSIFIKQGTWDVSQKSCVDKGTNALRSNKFQGVKADKSAVSGVTGNYRAVITCEAIEGVTGRIWYVVVVSGPALVQSRQLAQAIDQSLE